MVISWMSKGEIITTNQTQTTANNARNHHDGLFNVFWFLFVLLFSSLSRIILQHIITKDQQQEQQQQNTWIVHFLMHFGFVGYMMYQNCIELFIITIMHTNRHMSDIMKTDQLAKIWTYVSEGRFYQTGMDCVHLTLTKVLQLIKWWTNIHK